MSELSVPGSVLIQHDVSVLKRGNNAQTHISQYDIL